MNYREVVFDPLYVSAKNGGLIDWLKWYYRENGLPIEHMRRDMIEACSAAFGKVPFSCIVVGYALDMLDLWSSRECNVANDNDAYCGWPSDLANRPNIDCNVSRQRRQIHARLGHIRISHLPFRPWPKIHSFAGWRRDELVQLHQQSRSRTARLR